MAFPGSGIQLVGAKKSSPRSFNSHMCISYHIISCVIVLRRIFMQISHESLCTVTFKVFVRDPFLYSAQGITVSAPLYRGQQSALLLCSVCAFINFRFLSFLFK